MELWFAARGEPGAILVEGALAMARELGSGSDAAGVGRVRAIAAGAAARSGGELTVLALEAA